MCSSLDRIGEEIAADATHLDAALHRILTKLRVFDAGGGYASQGFRTCAQWLSWRVSWTMNTAREHVRVANALGGLPLLDRALERGELSYSKVRALTRVATTANEATLLDMALQMTGHHLEQLCRKLAWVKAHDDPDGASPTTAADDIDRRYVRRRDRDDGMVVIEAVLHPDEAEVVMAALERVAKERCRARPAAGAENTSAETWTPSTRTDEPSTTAPALPLSPSRSAAERRKASFDRATALVDMAQQVLRGASPDRAPFDVMVSIPVEWLPRADSRPSATTDLLSVDTACHTRSRDRHPAASGVHRAASLVPEAFAGPTRVACCSDPTRVAWCGNGTALSIAAARRLACDAGVVALIEDANGGALSVGRKQRTIPPAMKRAMLRRDHTCRFPGCSARAFLEGHHIEHWADGGTTSMDNVISLCSFHHRLAHEYGFTLEYDAETNAVSAYDPSHHRWIPAVPHPSPPADLGWPNIERRNERLSIDADTRPLWDATPVDYPEIVDVILRAEARAEETSKTSEQIPDDAIN